MAEYIESGIAQEMNNSQTRALAGNWRTSPTARTRPSCSIGPGSNVEQHFATVALTERFDESLVALARQFGWSKLSYVKAKVGGRREPVPPATLELIDRMNQLDRRSTTGPPTRLRRADRGRRGLRRRHGAVPPPEHAVPALGDRHLHGAQEDPAARRRRRLISRRTSDPPVSSP